MKIKLASDRMVVNGTNRNIIISSVQLALHSIWTQSYFSAFGAHWSPEEDVITQFLDLQHGLPGIAVWENTNTQEEQNEVLVEGGAGEVC